MHEAERHDIILHATQRFPVASLARLTGLTGASEATVRRDIAKLAAEGKLRRVRGGATALEPATPRLDGPGWDAATTRAMPQKRAIGRAAAALCEAGDTIVINGGTTTFQMAPHLDQPDLTVVTNSLPIANHLAPRDDLTLMLTGGTVYPEQQIMLSAFGADISDHIVPRRAFTGAQAITPRGVMETDPLLIQAETHLLARAEEIVILADSGKFGARGSLLMCPLPRVSTIVTDDGIAPEHRAMCEEAGIRLVVVEADP